MKFARAHFIVLLILLNGCYEGYGQKNYFTCSWNMLKCFNRASHTDVANTEAKTVPEVIKQGKEIFCKFLNEFKACHRENGDHCIEISSIKKTIDDLDKIGRETMKCDSTATVSSFTLVTLSCILVNWSYNK